ncbi:hypothetical protein EDD18DRAFT_1106324 [Armillaria luteobubalina]|uniref:Uncharacterized protein n=1 Tax=Armillaria luteobubalina TaxID=153913 RepID=A0AA39Q3T0_9AGAR|nr:hypothetical protein EDD18DRAFT_1106324 [Armillaria luteobubalina]
MALNHPSPLFLPSLVAEISSANNMSEQINDHMDYHQYRCHLLPLDISKVVDSQLPGEDLLSLYLLSKGIIDFPYDFPIDNAPQSAPSLGRSNSESNRNSSSTDDVHYDSKLSAGC